MIYDSDSVNESDVVTVRTYSALLRAFLIEFFIPESTIFYGRPIPNSEFIRVKVNLAHYSASAQTSNTGAPNSYSAATLKL
jgi:hypothetical protein